MTLKASTERNKKPFYLIMRVITYHACVMCNSPPSSFCEVGDDGSGMVVVGWNCRFWSSLAPSVVELAEDDALALLAAAGLVEKPKARIRSPWITTWWMGGASRTWKKPKRTATCKDFSSAFCTWSSQIFNLFQCPSSPSPFDQFSTEKGHLTAMDKTWLDVLHNMDTT